MTNLVFLFDELQFGYPQQQIDAPFLREPIGRFRTVRPFPLIVDKEPSCRNIECTWVHRRMALLNQPGRGHHVEGEVFEVSDDDLARLDHHYGYFPDDLGEDQCAFRREIEVEALDGDTRMRVEIHFDDPTAVEFLAKLECGAAEIVPHFTTGMAATTRKPCCIASPGHDAPHDEI